MEPQENQGIRTPNKFATWANNISFLLSLLAIGNFFGFPLPPLSFLPISIGAILFGIFGLIGKGNQRIPAILGIIFSGSIILVFWYFATSFLGLNFFGK